MYKALMLDVDGTTVPYDYDALPSDRVAEAIKKAQEKVVVCLVTGRSFGFIEKVLDKLSLHSGYAVVNNGSVVLDLETKEVVYQQPIDLKDAEEIVDLLTREKVPFYLKQQVFGLLYQGHHFTKGEKLTTPFMFFTDEILSSKQVDTIFSKLSHLPNLTLHKGHHKDPNKFNINISHAKATKLHGIEIVLEKLKIPAKDVIGVGDGYNDFPLLMASGLKVAMGNAVDDLKQIADYIAPSVEEDGVATVIDKFILGSKES